MPASVVGSLVLSLLCALSQTSMFGPALTADEQALSKKLQAASMAYDATSLVPLLGDSLRASNPEIRHEGLAVIFVRVTRAGPDGVMSPAEWPDVKAALLAQRPRVLELLDDENVRVRAGAVGSAAYLDYIARNFSSGPATVSAELASRLLARFKVEREPMARQAIAMLFQMSGGTEPADIKSVVDQIVVAALSDANDGVVAAALFGAGNRKIEALLPSVVERLKDPNRNTRMVAAESLASYGVLAKPYLPQLQAAAAIETDSITQKTMLGTISVLQKR